MLFKDVFAMRIGRKKFQHTTHCDAHASNTRFPALRVLNSDAIECAGLRHVFSVPERPFANGLLGSSKAQG
jgi:hypothetical protein